MEIHVENQGKFKCSFFALHAIFNCKYLVNRIRYKKLEVTCFNFGVFTNIPHCLVLVVVLRHYECMGSP